MSPLEAARRHLAKADEFLSEAASALQSGHLNVATSNAVIAGINAKDAEIAVRHAGQLVAGARAILS